MDSSDQRIGKTVAALRGERSQQSVADVMRERGHRWSQATMWAIEKGDRPLRLAEAADLVEILDAHVTDLLVESSEVGALRAVHDCYVAAVGRRDVAVGALDEMFHVRAVLAGLLQVVDEGGEGDLAFVANAREFTGLHADAIWSDLRNRVAEKRRSRAQDRQTIASMTADDAARELAELDDGQRDEDTSIGPRSSLREVEVMGEARQAASQELAKKHKDRSHKDHKATRKAEDRG